MADYTAEEFTCGDPTQHLEDGDLPRYRKEVVDLLLAIHNQKSGVNVELIEWFKCFEENTKRNVDDVFSVKRGNGYSNEVTQVMLLLRECVLAHRWKEAATVLSCFLQTPTSCRHTVHMVGSELLYLLPRDSYETVEQFITHCRRFQHIPKTELVLEYALYLIMIGQSLAADTWIKKVHFKEDISVRSARDKYIWKCYKGLSGITRYCEFRALKRSFEEGDELGEENYGYMTNYQVMTAKAAEAIDYLKACLSVESPHYFDYIITTLVELLEFQGKDDEALEVLEKYAQSHPENPNTYRYLMHYYHRHSKQEMELAYMKQYCDAVPSDEMTLELYIQLSNAGAPATDTLHLIFDLLDYGVWAHDARPWCLLAQQLKEIEDRGTDDEKNYMKQCWYVRRSWWPNYHFKVGKTKDSPEVLVHKAMAAAVLIGPDCAFLEEVLSCESKIQEMSELRQYIQGES